MYGVPGFPKGQHFARWKDTKGKTRTAPLTTGKDGTDRIVVKARTYTAKYRDGSGVVVEKATGCRDERAARAVLHELEVRADKVRSNLRTAAEDAAIDYQATPLTDHIAAFIDHEKAKGVSRRVNDTLSQLRRIATDCRFYRLADLNGSKLECWLVDRIAEGMSAASRNEYRGACVTFANWCVRNGRLLTNPFLGVPKADAKTDRRRQRRALTEDELARLLNVARRRPVLDAMTIRRGKNKGKAIARLRESTRIRLERLGWQRALLYKTLVLTGLRKKELGSLTVGQLQLDGPIPHLELEATDEKNREGSYIPLRVDLVDDLRNWLADKLRTLRDEARGRGQPIPVRLPADTPVFNVPAGLLRILNRDLKLAGIPKRDERGRTVDVHALRHTFGTHLSKGGVPPRTAQAAMRHSTIHLTMNPYTDPKLLDVAGTLEVLPSLPLTGGRKAGQIAASATGTDDSGPGRFAPVFAPTPTNRAH